MLDDAINLTTPDNVSDLSKLVKDTELEITELQAEDNPVYRPKIEYLMGLYHKIIDKLKSCCGITYKDRFADSNVPK